jgi:hypothetical protein
MVYEPELFRDIFENVILEGIDAVKLGELLKQIRAYLEGHTTRIFRPIIEYFRAEGDVRGLSDLSYHLNKMMPSDWWEIAVLSYGNWLTEYGYLERFSAPVRLTSKSRDQVYEIGYIFAG